MAYQEAAVVQQEEVVGQIVCGGLRNQYMRFKMNFFLNEPLSECILGWLKFC